MIWASQVCLSHNFSLFFLYFLSPSPFIEPPDLYVFLLAIFFSYIFTRKHSWFGSIYHFLFFRYSQFFLISFPEGHLLFHSLNVENKLMYFLMKSSKILKFLNANFLPCFSSVSGSDFVILIALFSVVDRCGCSKWKMESCEYICLLKNGLKKSMKCIPSY